MARNVPVTGEKTRHEGSVKGVSGINILLGLAILVTPFLALSEGRVAEFMSAVGAGNIAADVAAAFWMNIAVGVLIIALSAYNAWAASRHHTENVMAPAGLNVLLGLWLAVWAFITPITVAYFWADLLLGLGVAILAAYNSWAGYADRRPTARPSR